MDHPEASLHFYDPRVEIEKRTTILPHWEQPGPTYFVSFRLADSIPRSKLDAWKAERDAWMAVHPQPWTDEIEREYHKRFSATIDRWLDLGHGECVLRDPTVARVVGDAMSFFENQRSIQYAWVIMPNHVHTLFTVLREWKLDRLLHSWKSFTANKIKFSPEAKWRTLAAGLF
jgi:putative transposase